jgi:signal transduction histidine kinase/DNA-binding response OmpR family regulator
MPASDRAQYEDQDILAVLLYPVFIENEFWGFVSLHDLQRERALSGEEIIMLRSVGIMMSNAIKRGDYLEKIKEDSIMLQAQAHWYGSILDAIPLPVSVITTDLIWSFMNKAMEDMLGKNRESLIGLACSTWGMPICGTDNCSAKRAFSGEKNSYMTHNGIKYKVSMEMLNNLKGLHSGFISIFQNITEIEAITREKADAEAANQAKTRFLATISHEIRTPMNAIMGITEMQMLNENLSPEIQESLNRIYNSGKMLVTIINDLLDLSKIEAGKLELQSVKYDVCSMLNDAVQLIIMQFENKPIEFTLDVGENTPVNLYGDELRIRQILNNLLSNAYKYTTKGNVTLSLRSEWDGESDTVILVFKVSDTGQGMTPDQVDKLFDEYTRFNMDANRTTMGTGLGMNITRLLTALMKGTISVESEKDKGSVFTVRIPQRSAGSGVVGKTRTESLKRLQFMSDARAAKSNISREQMPYGRVLVVDDVETNLFVARLLLKPYGIQIDEALDGFTAVKMIEDMMKKGEAYDIVFMDHMMPKMDGIQATKILRDLGYKEPVVALTANAVSGQSDIFMKNGFDGFIAKPIDVREMNAALNKWVRNKHISGSAVKPKPPEAPPALSEADIQLRKIFAKDAQRVINTLKTVIEKNSYDEENLKTATINTHGIKSALLMIGESALSSEALGLEKAGRGGDIEFVARELPGFVEKLEMFVEKL